jgi:hypothetical protein
VHAAHKVEAGVDALMMRLENTALKEGYFHEKSDWNGSGD